MTQTAKSSLTILNAHTDVPQIFWNGKILEGVKSINIDNSSLKQRVIITLPEDPTIAEMQAAGIIIRRN